MIREMMKPAADYLELIGTFPLRQLKTKAQYRRAGELIDQLSVHAEGTLSQGKQDYLYALSVLIEDYDRTHRVEKQVDPNSLLKHLMEESGMTTTALGELLGSKTAASLVLNRKRSLSKAHIAKLSDHFKLSPAAFFATDSAPINAVA